MAAFCTRLLPAALVLLASGSRKKLSLPDDRGLPSWPPAQRKVEHQLVAEHNLTVGLYVPPMVTHADITNAGFNHQETKYENGIDVGNGDESKGINVLKRKQRIRDMGEELDLGTGQHVRGCTAPQYFGCCDSGCHDAALSQCRVFIAGEFHPDGVEESYRHLGFDLYCRGGHGATTKNSTWSYYMRQQWGEEDDEYVEEAYPHLCVAASTLEVGCHADEVAQAVADEEPKNKPKVILTRTVEAASVWMDKASDSSNADDLSAAQVATVATSFCNSDEQKERCEKDIIPNNVCKIRCCQDVCAFYTTDGSCIWQCWG